jgi:phosphoserine aminotransferase
MKHNFSPGPSYLDEGVLLKAKEALSNYKNLGVSILELSHRSSEFQEILQKSKSLVKKLMNLDENYEILFLSGGASLHFAMIPLNFLNKKAGYIDTGRWSSKAIEEAKKLEKVEIVASSKDQNYAYIPKIKGPFRGDYLHFTSNNTVYGTQFGTLPNYKADFVCDMTSDIFSRELDFSKFSFIYAGTQKNLGIVGLSLVIIKKEFLEKSKTSLPSYLSYEAHIKEKNLLNTPNVFGIYMALLSLEWIDLKGLKEVEKQNKEKANLLYNEIDRNSFFEGICKKENRSMSNAVFKFKSENLKEKFSFKFEQMAKEANIIGIKGHRSVGNYRASLYNFIKKTSVEVLINLMQEFEKKYG